MHSSTLGREGSYHHDDIHPLVSPRRDIFRAPSLPYLGQGVHLATALAATRSTGTVRVAAQMLCAKVCHSVASPARSGVGTPSSRGKASWQGQGPGKALVIEVLLFVLARLAAKFSMLSPPFFVLALLIQIPS